MVVIDGVGPVVLTPANLNVVATRLRVTLMGMGHVEYRLNFLPHASRSIISLEGLPGSADNPV